MQTHLHHTWEYSHMRVFLHMFTDLNTLILIFTFNEHSSTQFMLRFFMYVYVQLYIHLFGGMLGCMGKGWSCWVRMVAVWDKPAVICRWYSTIVADSEEKLCRLVSEFGRVCERRKLRVNVGKSKVMRCSRYGKFGSNACDTKRLTLRRSRLF